MLPNPPTSRKMPSNSLVQQELRGRRFRGQRTAAPLKLVLISRILSTVASFRGQRTAAPLKPLPTEFRPL